MSLDPFLSQLHQQLNVYIPTDGIHDMAIKGMSAIQFQSGTVSHPKPTPVLYRPSLWLILQGSKRVFSGQEEYIYGEGDFLIASVDMPAAGCVTETPYTCLKFDLNPKIMTELLEEHIISPDSQFETSPKGFFVGKADVPLLKAFSKGIDLLDTPEDLPFMEALFEKEWHYRLLKGHYGYMIAQFAFNGTIAHKLAHVISWMKEDLSRSLSVPECAFQAGMSESSFYDHFKKLTGFSPLQYYKNLRLLQARQMILSSAKTATQVAYDVGYESPTQFTREYKRLFGLPPLQDFNQFRQTLTQYAV